MNLVQLNIVTICLATNVVASLCPKFTCSLNFRKQDNDVIIAKIRD